VPDNASPKIIRNGEWMTALVATKDGSLYRIGEHQQHSNGHGGQVRSPIQSALHADDCYTSYMQGIVFNLECEAYRAAKEGEGYQVAKGNDPAAERFKERIGGIHYEKCQGEMYAQTLLRARQRGVSRRASMLVPAAT
jgi:hypothetical protein